jgi:hypothetical protein
MAKPTKSNLVDNYFKLQKELFKYFGYTQNWCIIPTDPCMGKYWMITGPKDQSSTSVVWSPVQFTKQTIEDGDSIYSGTIYTQRFLSKWVYRGKNHTMVSVDTHTDGNKALMIFDNDKECTDPELIALYKATW